MTHSELGFPSGRVFAQDGGVHDTQLPVGTVTLLLTDLEGSTRLWEADVDMAAEVLARHHDLLDAAISLHGGMRPEEQGEGDSIVAAFVSPSEAVAAALDIQLAFEETGWPEGIRPRLRIAVHTGEVSLRDARNYQGPTIIRCARLRNAAHGGQTVVSDATRDVVVDGLPDQASLQDLGPHRLKDLGRAEHVWQLCHPDLEREFPLLRSLDLHPNNLPVQLTPLVGRAGDLDELTALLGTSRLVTLTGAGGSGKTRLAMQLAADVADRHSGVWWVELAPVRASAGVGIAVAAVLGLQEEHDRPIVDTLVEQLHGSCTLLVVDNCEQVLDGAAALLHALLIALPDLTVIATSREPLGVPGEVSWRIPSLEESAASLLFVDRARRARSGFTPDAEQLETIAHICRRLDGLPLGIELAAARIRMMNPTRIAASLDDRFRLLTGGSRTAMPRQQTLEASVAWSHDLLDESERAVFRRLSVFEGGFTLDAAESVVADGDLVDDFAVLDVIARLVDKSLVNVGDDGTDARYRLLETIRQFARERLVEVGESDATRELHLDYFLGLAETAAPELAIGGGLAWLARLEDEHANLQGSLDWAVSTAESGRLLRLAGALTLFWELRGHLQEAGRWFRARPRCGRRRLG